jgi:hypothetical protein
MKNRRPAASLSESRSNRRFAPLQLLLMIATTLPSRLEGAVLWRFKQWLGVIRQPL